MGLIDNVERDRDPRTKENVIVPPPPPPQATNTEPLAPGQLPTSESPIPGSDQFQGLSSEVPQQDPTSPAQYGLDQNPLPTDATFSLPPDELSASLPAAQPGLDSTLSVLGGAPKLDRFGDVALPPIAEGETGGMPTGQPGEEGGEPDYQIPEGFGTQTPAVINQINQQLQAQKDAQQSLPMESLYTSGDIAHGVYEAQEGFKRQMADNANSWYNSRTQSIHEAESSLRQQLQNPSIPGRPNVGGQRFNPDPLKNPFQKPEDAASSGDFIKDGLNAFLNWAEKSGVSNVGRALGFRGDGKTFDPWAGGKQFLDDFKKDPAGNWWKIPFLPFIVGGTGKYGEFGEGYAGSAMYILGFADNMSQAAATSLYNILTGNYRKEIQNPSIVQGLLGKSFDFTNENRPDTPIGFLGKNTTPKTWSELQHRSVLYSGANPAFNLAIEAIKKIQGDKIPDWLQKKLTHPDGGTWLRYPEFFAALAADLAIPSPQDVIKLFSPKYWAKLGGKLETEAAKAGETAAKLRPDRPQNIEIPTPPKVPDVPEAQAKTPRYAQQYPFPVRPGSAKAEEIRQMHLRNPLNAPPVPPSTVVRHIATKGGTIDPASVISVVRSNEDLTKLAIARGDYAGTIPLNKKRLDALAADDPIYSRLGLPIPDEVKQAIQLSNPLNPQPLSLNEAFAVMKDITQQMSKTTDPDELFRLSREGDDLMTQITNAPVVIRPSVLEEVHKTLPREQIARTPDGVKATQDMLDAEHKYTEAAEIAADLHREVGDIKEELANYLTKMDELAPDVGRRPLEAEMPYTPKPPAVEREIDFTPKGVTDTGVMAKRADEINTQDWYHGSKVRGLDFNVADPVVGGSRGEFGTAHYFTNQFDDAVDYALAEPSKNLPQLDTREFSEIGNVYKAKLQVRNPLDAATSPPPDVVEAIAKAVNDSPLIDKSVQRSINRWISKNGASASLQDYYNKIDDAIVKGYGHYPEEAGLDVMRRVNDEIRNLGYDAIRSVNDADGSVVLAHLGGTRTHPITVTDITQHGTGDLLEQAIHRYNADYKSVNRVPKSIQAQANAIDSTANLITRIGERTDQQLTGATAEADRLARDLIQKQRRLETVAETERRTQEASRLREARRTDSETIRHNNKVDDNPCL